MAKAITLVILAFAGSEAILGKVWEKNGPGDFKLIPVKPDESLKDILLENVITDPEVEDRFVLVPANLVPCSKITLEELCCPAVYVFKDKETWWGRTPVVFDKTALEEFLPENDVLSDEDFVRKWVKTHLSRPVLVSREWGNYLSVVLRADPCWAKVAEAMVRKKFIFANPAGFNAIASQIVKVLL